MLKRFNIPLVVLAILLISMTYDISMTHDTTPTPADATTQHPTLPPLLLKEYLQHVMQPCLTIVTDRIEWLRLYTVTKIVKAVREKRKGTETIIADMKKRLENNEKLRHQEHIDDLDNLPQQASFSLIEPHIMQDPTIKATFDDLKTDSRHIFTRSVIFSKQWIEKNMSFLEAASPHTRRHIYKDLIKTCGTPAPGSTGEPSPTL